MGDAFTDKRKMQLRAEARERAHDALMKTNPYYAEMYDKMMSSYRQMDYYKREIASCTDVIDELVSDYVAKHE